MVVYTQEHVYRHPWDRVTAAAWRKFTDPASRTALSHVADVHTLHRSLDPAEGRLHAARSITVRSPPLPFILRRLVPAAAASPSGAALCHCVETSLVDARSRAMDVVVRNVSLRGLIEVEERASYRPHPDRADEWTQFRQETTIRCRPLATVAEKVEHRCAEKFLQNSAKGREVVERSAGTSRPRLLALRPPLLIGLFCFVPPSLSDRIEGFARSVLRSAKSDLAC
jgi:hypothetical protein